MDLPAPKKASSGRKFETPFDEWEADLPAPKRPGRPSAGAFGEVDLPAPKRPGRPSAGAFGPAGEEADLPVVKRGGGRGRGPDAGVDLPAPKRPKPRSDLGELDLPMPKQGPPPVTAPVAPPGGRRTPALDDLDMPTPGHRGGNLGELDLPALDDNVDLPTPKDAVDLPVSKGAVDLPARKGTGPDAVDLPMAKGQKDLPAPATDRLDLPARRGQGDLPAMRDLPDFGEIELPEGPGTLPDLDDGLPLPEPRPRGPVASAEVAELAEPVEAASSAAAGGEARSGEADASLEFDAIPEEAPDAAMGLGVDVHARPQRMSRPAFAKAAREAPAKKGGRRGALRPTLITAGVLAVLVGVGFALGFTSYGYFGVYFFEQLLPQARDTAQVHAAIDKAAALARSDTLPDARAGLRVLAQARRQAGLNRQLLSRSLLAESMFQVRFGEQPDSAARAGAIDSRLAVRGYQAPHAALARAALALSRGQVGQAEALLGAARAASAADPLFPLVEGEIDLAQGHPKPAVAAFERAVKAGDGARATWGLARAERAAGDQAAWMKAVDDTLKLSPRHAAARVAAAEDAFARGELDRAERLAREAAGASPVGGKPLRAAADTRAAAWSMVGLVDEHRGQRGAAHDAYAQALKADAYRPAALLGMGRVLLAERQYDDALTRFHAALDALSKSSPDARVVGDSEPKVSADIGAVQALIALGRVQDARVTMDKLLSQHPNDPRVLLWVGKAAQAAKDDATAIKRYRQVMLAAPKDFSGYLALSQLLFEEDRPADAAAVLDSAKENVPETAEMRRMLGESELKRGHTDAAITEFKRALALDANDVAALFGIGVAQRTAGHLDAAAATLEQVAARDPSYPGLAVERGRVYEARGEAQRAVQSYRAALAKHPDDPDLMLRLGSALVATGQIDQAEQQVKKAMHERTNSAEGEYLLGRVELARNRTDQALQHFDRATQLDGTRGEFHMYEARALLDQGSLARAYEEVQKALSLDSNLADAYWVRGQLRLRSGAVKDALDDFEKTLSLDPSRYDAYAGMGDSYDQLGKRSDAIHAYETALAHDNARGDWWYRLGRLQLDSGDRAAAAKSLARATVLGDAAQVPPGWLADAHRMQADLLAARGDRKEAIDHYRRYLDIASPGAIDRQDVQKKLLDLGASPN